MSQYVSDEKGEGVQVATNLGWSEFSEWALACSVDDYPWLHHLVTFGFANESGDLAAEIRHALENSSPAADVKSVADGLIKYLEAVPDAEIVLISNGMTIEE